VSTLAIICSIWLSTEQHAPSQQVAAINGPSYKEVVLLMDGLREKLDTIDERL